MSTEAPEELGARGQYVAEIHALRATSRPAALAIAAADDEGRQVIVLGEAARDKPEHTVGPLIALDDHDVARMLPTDLAPCLGKHRLGGGLALQIERFEPGSDLLGLG